MLCFSCEKEIEEGEEKEVDDEFYCPDCYEEKFRECGECNNIFPFNDLTQIDGDYYCDDCRDEKFVICDDCGDYCSYDDSRRTADDGYICEECFGDHYTTCGDCGDVIRDRNAIDVHSNGYICNNCYEDNYFTCDGCDNVFHRDDLFGADDGSYCGDCYNDHSGTIHQYHSGSGNIRFHKMPNEKNVQFAGLELEIECKKNDPDECAENIIGLSDDENLFKLEHDGSLNNGFEVISQPCSLKYFKQKFPLAQIVEKLTADGCVSHNTDTCGLHVHVSRKYLSLAEQIKVGLFMGFNSDKLSRFARRDYNNYCKNNIMEKKGNFIDMAENSSDRYESVNYTNHKTIEFRLFRGTLKKETIFATLEFCFMLCDFVKTVNFNQIQSVDSWKLFCSFIKDKKEINYLIDYLKIKNIMEV